MDLNPKGFLTILLAFYLWSGISALGLLKCLCTSVSIHIQSYCMKAKFACNGQRNYFIVIVCICNDRYGKTLYVPISLMFYEKI